MADNPCKTCTRVRDPNNCENKICRDWQAWFVERWEAIRRYYEAQLPQKECAEDG